ncbi:MAG: bifunctional phosphopantothenoylcysteine decarboxylase/phosphopantothenate--cysteine ligase CoaBC [Actinobacteria bacterium]|nr:bifunctional phosphopantothenoylcysteine decarboxylase/phosphopantothenate--cysteine ligase CoaBC [Actinomycetota bacterium]
MSRLAGKNVVLGVSGGIAVYKAVELSRLLVKKGANVKAIMTEAASRFVNPLTFRVATGNPVTTSMWSDPGLPIPHISLSEEADIILVAPATANIVAKCANGIADDILSTTLLAARGKIVFAPAMNSRMYLNHATQENLSTLIKRGITIVEPEKGELACGDEGVGRMAEPPVIVETLECLAVQNSDLEGLRIMVTAGPTREHIDPVRFISNPSTGRMGYAIADLARKRGAEVTLVTGPTSLEPPIGVNTHSVVSASEMKDTVMAGVGSADVLVMTAAVADYTPGETSKSKIKKKDGPPGISLRPTADILREVSKEKRDLVVVGFAAETDDVVENALQKMREKKMDFIVANKVAEEGTGFASETNLATILSPDDSSGTLSLVTKCELASMILDKIASLAG